jgi:hypothetical protein
VGEFALIRDTISHYAPLLIAPLSIQIRRAGVQKKFRGRSFEAVGGQHEHIELIASENYATPAVMEAQGSA